MDDLWALERRLWLEGADAYSDLMSDACVMIFGPMGIMQRAAILESLQQAPRWTAVSFHEEIIASNTKTAVLAYRTIASRDGAKEYSALCCSTYVLDGGGWKILAHQQTPL